MGYNTVKKMKGTKIVLAGLGTPGKEYDKTYHNVGRMFLDFLPGRTAWQRPGRRPFEYRRAENFILVRPLLYMNESGRAVASALNYFKTEPERLLVAQDESDLVLGTYKISKNRGAAGHRGILSILKELGTPDFTRIRIGIHGKSGKAGGFVLNKMSTGDLEKLHLVFGDILKLIEKE
ncbi:MAG: aminoacyl-tRNA hydrolase [Candidatus Liptonbacteria bacterium]